MYKPMKILLIALVVATPIIAHAEGLTAAQKTTIQESLNPSLTYSIIMNRSQGHLRISDENGTEYIDLYLERLVLSKFNIGDRCRIVGWSGHAGSACNGFRETCSSFWKIDSASRAD